MCMVNKPTYSIYKGKKIINVGYTEKKKLVIIFHPITAMKNS